MFRNVKLSGDCDGGKGGGVEGGGRGWRGLARIGEGWWVAGVAGGQIGPDRP